MKKINTIVEHSLIMGEVQLPQRKDLPAQMARTAVLLNLHIGSKIIAATLNHIIQTGGEMADPRIK